MPENESHPQEVSEQPEAIFPQTLEEAMAERLQEATVRLENFYTSAIEAGQNPVEMFVHDLKIPRLEILYGSKAVAEVVTKLEALPVTTERPAFVHHVREIIAPFLRAEVADPEVRRRIEALNEAVKIEFKDPMSEQRLLGNIAAVDHDLAFQDGTNVHYGAKVIEIAWPKEAAGPSGLNSVKRVLGEMANYLDKNPDIQAVTAVSWMFSHPLTKKLGFEVFPDFEFPDHQRLGSSKMGNDARLAKGQPGNIALEQVHFGGMSREAFLNRYTPRV